MKTLVLIGNAPVKTDLSGFIDAGDSVVRLNDCRNYRVNTGSKSDILFLNNTGDPARVRNLEYLLRPRSPAEIERDLPFIRTVRRVVFARPPAESCRTFLLQHIPEDNPLRREQLAEIAPERNLSREITRVLGLDDRCVEFVAEDFYTAVWRKLLRYGNTKAIMPSTGLLALEYLLHHSSADHHPIYVAGFSHEGWSGHPWELERRLFADYIERGNIVPLDKSGLDKRSSIVVARTRSAKPAPGRAIQELFLISKVDYGWCEKVREKYDDSRVVFWDPHEPDGVALRCASALARHTIVEDALVPEATELLRRPVTPLSRFDRKIACELGQGAASSTGSGRDDPFATGEGPVLFCPFNDTHVRTFAPIAQLLDDYCFLLCGDARGEQAEETLMALGLDYRRDVPRAIARIKPSALVLAKDWSPEARRLMAEARRTGIPVICVQEGPTEFRRDRRMQRCDYPLVQGAVMLRYLDQRIHMLAGNARFDRLAPVSLPATPNVMLNCNFWNDAPVRSRWLEVAIQACRAAGMDFFISRHPRESGDLPGSLPVRRSGPGLIHEQLAECSVVITPHSSIIYEALLMGRAVICHDPRRGRIDAFDDDRTGAFTKTGDSAELIQALKSALLPMTAEHRACIQHFLDQHCGARDGRVARRNASAIAAISRTRCPIAYRDIPGFFLRKPAISPSAFLRCVGDWFSGAS